MSSSHVPWRRRRLPSMPKAGSTVRPMATSTIRRRGAGPGRACIPVGQWPAGTLARQGCLHGLRDRVRAGPEFPGAVAGMARRPAQRALHVLAVEGHPFAPADLAAVGAPRARRWPAWRASWRLNGRCRCLACIGSNSTAGRHADLGLWRGANGGAAFGRLRGCVFPGWFCARAQPAHGNRRCCELAAMAAPGATLATWACTGELRRALSESGFDARRETGYGGKWHMTVATARAEGARARRRAPASGRAATPSWWAQAWPAPASRRLGYAVARVTVLDAARAGGVAAHAGHMAAALTPVVARDDNARARLSRAGSARALARWRDCLGPHRASAARCN